MLYYNYKRGKKTERKGKKMFTEMPKNTVYMTKREWMQMLEQFNDDDYVELINYDDEIIHEVSRFALSHDVAARQEAEWRVKNLAERMNKVVYSKHYKNEDNRKKKWNQLYKSWLFWEEKRINHAY